jgi:hypothetical protein
MRVKRQRSGVRHLNLELSEGDNALLMRLCQELEATSMRTVMREGLRALDLLRKHREPSGDITFLNKDKEGNEKRTSYIILALGG